MFLFCLVFAMFCAPLFICVLWSPAGKGLTSWLSFVVSTVSLSLSHWYPGSGVVLKVTTHSNNRNSKSSREVILGSVRL